MARAEALRPGHARHHVAADLLELALQPRGLPPRERGADPQVDLLARADGVAHILVRLPQRGQRLGERVLPQRRELRPPHAQRALGALAHLGGREELDGRTRERRTGGAGSGRRRSSARGTHRGRRRSSERGTHLQHLEGDGLALAVAVEPQDELGRGLGLGLELLLELLLALRHRPHDGLLEELRRPTPPPLVVRRLEVDAHEVAGHGGDDVPARREEGMRGWEGVAAVPRTSRVCRCGGAGTRRCGCTETARRARPGSATWTAPWRSPWPPTASPPRGGPGGPCRGGRGLRGRLWPAPRAQLAAVVSVASRTTGAQVVLWRRGETRSEPSAPG